MAMNGGGDGGFVTEEKRLGKVVQAARRSAGLTQQALCQKSGLSYSTLAKIERGAIKAPSIFTIQQISNTLDMSLDQLMQGVAASVPQPKPPLVAAKKSSKSGVRFVYFDMNGCLVRYYHGAFNQLAEDAGTTPDAVEAIFWRYNDEVNRGEMSMDQFNTALAEKLGIMVDWVSYYLEAVKVTDGMAELVDWVAENYKVGILTNTMPGLIGPMLENGLLPRVQYDAIVESCEVHALKPEPAIFEIATERAGVAPEEILLIDDDRGNVSAASKFGWHAISFDGLHTEESIVSIGTALQPAA